MNKKYIKLLTILSFYTISIQSLFKKTAPPLMQHSKEPIKELLARNLSQLGSRYFSQAHKIQNKSSLKNSSELFEQDTIDEIEKNTDNNSNTDAFNTKVNSLLQHLEQFHNNNKENILLAFQQLQKQYHPDNIKRENEFIRIINKAKEEYLSTASDNENFTNIKPYSHYWETMGKFQKKDPSFQMADGNIYKNKKDFINKMMEKGHSANEAQKLFSQGKEKVFDNYFALYNIQNDPILKKAIETNVEGLFNSNYEFKEAIKNLLYELSTNTFIEKFIYKMENLTKDFFFLNTIDAQFLADIWNEMLKLPQYSVLAKNNFNISSEFYSFSIKFLKQDLKLENNQILKTQKQNLENISDLKKIKNTIEAYFDFAITKINKLNTLKTSKTRAIFNEKDLDHVIHMMHRYSSPKNKIDVIRFEQQYKMLNMINTDDTMEKFIQAYTNANKIEAEDGTYSALVIPAEWDLLDYILEKLRSEDKKKNAGFWEDQPTQYDWTKYFRANGYSEKEHIKNYLQSIPKEKIANKKIWEVLPQIALDYMQQFKQF